MARIIKPLTDSQVKQAKPENKAYKLADGGGMYLYITKLGAKSWRMNYLKPITKKYATLTLGLYPEVTLAQAREQRKEIRALLAEGVDPQQKKLEDDREKLLLSNNTFAAIAEEYMGRKTHIAKSTQANNYRQIKRLNKYIGDTPMTDIKPMDILDACRSAEAQGYLETAIKMRTMAGQVFRYAVQTARAERDITQDLIGALQTPVTKHHPTTLDPKDLGELLNAIDDYQGSFEVRTAIKLMPMLFVRAGELRYALWNDFCLDEGTWTFTPRKTQRRTGLSLIVPLPRQAIELVRELSLHARSKYLFPAVHTTVQPMSENTMNQALKRLGYDGTKQTIHGFRATARTLIVEKLKYPENLVEMQLGHRVRDMHGRAYNRTVFLEERRDMMQAYADYLDDLKAE
ncbi:MULTISPECIES: tyrosine-type recombinase/integrase [unclassified Psychrobacter]|jgi:integrase|uniref:tyrosine-type recombinase/integrase n=1 Tax=unclassified Psychrobacter TaxID=196806 RepID=UPI0017883C6D|nr:integrase arm-type DNA-binding domain-containing protein [Psychrobacter sp. FME13]MBE0440638.1 integrase arm-type DNA-binding domain-containing protein [Psychrobacter sp. FME13]